MIMRPYNINIYEIMCLTSFFADERDDGASGEQPPADCPVL